MNPGASDRLSGITLLDRYLSGEATPAEIEMVELRMPEYPEVKKQLCDPVTYLATSEHELGEAHRQSWEMLAARITQTTALQAEQGTSATLRTSTQPQPWVTKEASASPLRTGAMPVSRYQSVRTWISQSRTTSVSVIAMLVAIVVTIGGITVVRGRSTGSTIAPVEQTYVTAAGQQAIIRLDDGSQATLGPSSQLTASIHPTTGTTVTMTGQALFVVAHRANHPFVVRTANTITRVLGTSFLVRRYASDRAARILVTEGRVSLRSTSNTAQREAAASMPTDTGVVLSANMLGAVDDSGRVNVTPKVTSDDYLAWITGRLVFRQAPIHEIVAELSRVYGVDLRVTDTTLRKRAFTWTVSVNQLTLTDVLNVLTTALQAHVTKSGHVLTLEPGSSSVRNLPKTRFPLPIPSEPREPLYGR